MISLVAQAQVTGPEIDWDALSPVVALTAGACLVLLVGLARAPLHPRAVVPVLTLADAARHRRAGVWQWGENASIIEDALAMDDLTRALTTDLRGRRGRRGRAVAGARWRRPRRARASTTRCC